MPAFYEKPYAYWKLQTLFNQIPIFKINLTELSADFDISSCVVEQVVG